MQGQFRAPGCECSEGAETLGPRHDLDCRYHARGATHPVARWSLVPKRHTPKAEAWEWRAPMRGRYRVILDHRRSGAVSCGWKAQREGVGFFYEIAPVGFAYRSRLDAMRACSRDAGKPDAVHDWTESDAVTFTMFGKRSRGCGHDHETVREAVECQKRHIRRMNAAEEYHDRKVYARDPEHRADGRPTMERTNTNRISGGWTVLGMRTLTVAEWREIADN